MNPKILGIDSAHEPCSVALSGCGEIRQHLGEGRRQHARQLLPLIESLLEDCQVRFADLDALAIIQGPGSFTGLRIGSSIAQGLAFSVGLPVVRISSLAMLAAAAHERHGWPTMLVCLQARSDEFYWASYHQTGARPELHGCERAGPAHAIEPDPEARAAFPDALWNAVGDGWDNAALQPLRDRLGAGVASDIHGDAALLVRLACQAWCEGEWVPAEQAVPVYIKDEMDYRRHPGR